MNKPIDAFSLYKEMVKEMHECGFDTSSMWPAYLMGELRKARARIKELEQQTGDI